MMDHTAQGAYGFGSWAPKTPGGVAVMPETQIGTDGVIPKGVTEALPLNWENPLFWLLILFLVFTGWMYGGAAFGFKKIGNVNLKVGR